MAFLSIGAGLDLGLRWCPGRGGPEGAGPPPDPTPDPAPDPYPPESGRVRLVVRAGPERPDAPSALDLAFRRHDDGRLTCQVFLADTCACPETTAPRVTIFQVVSRTAGPDVSLFQTSGVHILNADISFDSEGLTFRLTGDDVSVDPETGVINISAELLQTGLEVTLNVTDALGTRNAYQISIAQNDRPEPPEQPTGSVPVLVAAPAIAGSGRIGETLGASRGTWNDAESFTFQWLRNGNEIAGATGANYVPVDADDLAALSCRVMARNAAGSATAVSAALTVTLRPPAAAGTQADVTFVQGTGAKTLDLGAAFEGPELVFSVRGAGAVIDAGTGLVSFSTDALIDGEEIVVTASNSGGSDALRFRVSVEPMLLAPVVLATLEDVEFTLGTGVQTVSAQAGFAGLDLEYVLDAAPEGIAIDAVSGLIRIPTDAAAAGLVTVRTVNASGSASQSFRITIRAVASVFDTAAALKDLGFLPETAAPAWTFDAATGAGRLAPATTGRLHGDWVHAGGDGTYRCLARWSAVNSTLPDLSPFVFGARVTRSGGNFRGVYVEAFKPAKGTKLLRLQQYTGAGSATTLLAEARPGWAWDSWHWLDVQIVGPTVRARIYPEGTEAPDWQLAGSTTVSGDGAFGPAGFPLDGVSPTILIRRMEFAPAAAAEAPAAAGSADWSAAQFTEQS
jgi:hypothetical protein